MPEALVGVDAKIERAKRHLAELRADIATAFDPAMYRVVSERDGESNKYVYRAYDVPPINPAWSTIVGDYLFNLRSALEHLAWQLVLLDGKEPKSGPGGTTFPIWSEPPKSGRVQLNPPVESEEMLDALDRVQPYHRVADGAPTDYRTSFLWLLHQLNLIDKHRLLLVVVCALDVSRASWGLPEGYTTAMPRHDFEPVQEGDAVIEFDFKDKPMPPNFAPRIELQPMLREPVAPTMGVDNLPDVLRTLTWVVEDFVLNQHFRRLFD